MHGFRYYKHIYIKQICNINLQSVFQCQFQQTMLKLYVIIQKAISHESNTILTFVNDIQ